MSAFDIPELLEQVAIYLSAHDLTQCARVNRTWNTLFTPFVWHTVPPLPSQAAIATTPVAYTLFQGQDVWDTYRHRDFFTQMVQDDLLFATQQRQQQQEHHPSSGDNNHDYLSTLSHCRLIKHLDIHHFSMGPVAPRHRVSEASPGVTQVHYTTGETLMFHFLKRCTNLQTLRLSTMHLFYKYVGHRCWKRIVRTCLSETLKELEIAFPSPVSFADSQVVPLLFSRCPLQLQKLSLGYGHREGFLDLQENDGDYNDMDNKDDVIDKDWEDKSVPLLPAMKELRVTGRNMDDLYPPSWSRFLGRCDHLRALLVSSIDQGWVQALAECRTLERLTLIKAKTGNLRLLTTALRTGLPSLSALCVTDNNSPDEEMAFVLSACRAGWRSIELPIIGSRSVDALIEHHCPTLEILKVSRARDMSSTQMIQILASSPRLHTFVTFDEEVIPNPDVPHFVADDFIDLDHSTGQLRPWLCESTLKEFRAYVTGIPRPDLNKTFHGHPLDKDMVMQESFPGQGPELQRLVYERLARFSRLERLQLGHDDRLISVMYMLMYSDADIEGWDDESHQYNCLEMSLASGLRALEGLKELKELKVSRMATAVGIDDVQWMVQSWPRLKTLSGLNYSAEAEVQAASWLKETCPSIALRMCQKRGK